MVDWIKFDQCNLSKSSPIMTIIMCEKYLLEDNINNNYTVYIDLGVMLLT